MANPSKPNWPRDARCTRCRNGSHVLHLHRRGGEFIVVGGGRRAYLWAGAADGSVATLSGVATLRKVAKAILQEVGDVR